MSKTHRFDTEHTTTRPHTPKRGVYDRTAIKRDLSAHFDQLLIDEQADYEDFLGLMADIGMDDLT